MEFLWSPTPQHIKKEEESERSDFNEFGHKLHKLFAIILKIK